MDTIIMNSGKSKTSESYGLLLDYYYFFQIKLT